ncbi:TPA: hypothetical protein ACH3X1_015565 [Trebouxia sp. C0004]
MRLGQHPALGLAARSTCHITVRKQRSFKTAISASSKRQAKDPSKYGSMDNMRTHLEQQSQGNGGFAGFLNWLGSNAFGASRQHSKRQPWSLAAWYRWLLQSSWSQQLTSGIQRRPGYVANRTDQISTLPESPSNIAADPERLHLLAGLLLCSEQCVIRMAQKHPELPTMDPAEVTQRLMLLKEVFPACNVARMVELLPEGFLQQSQQSMVKHVAAINDALRGSLPGANIDMMVQEDPTILFEDKQSLSTGLRGLHDLWDVDEVALGNSNPWELALAIRAMSEQGPPNKV